MKHTSRNFVFLAFVSGVLLLATGCRGMKIDQIDKRVAQLETRVAVLESQIASHQHK